MRTMEKKYRWMDFDDLALALWEGVLRLIYTWEVYALYFKEILNW